MTDKTDNELIAEFMGAKVRRVTGPLTGEWYYEVKLTPNANWQGVHYHTSWDWLMPVVEKIESLYNEAFRKMGGNTEFIRKILAHERPIIDDHYMEVIALPLASKIDEAYKAVVTFIKWYNSQNNHP